MARDPGKEDEPGPERRSDGSVDAAPDQTGAAGSDREGEPGADAVPGIEPAEGDRGDAGDGLEGSVVDQAEFGSPTDLEGELLASVEGFFHDHLPGMEPDSDEGVPAGIEAIVRGGDYVGDLEEREPNLLGRLVRLVRGRKGPGPADRAPSAEFIETRWFDFEFLEDYEVVEHYWVQRPFAHVTILYDPEAKRRYYHVSEPVLDSFEAHLRRTLVQVLRSELMYTELELGEDRSVVFARELLATVNEYAATVNPGTVHKLIYYLIRDFLNYAEIDPLMRDEEIEDISCDGVDIPVYVFHGEYRDLRTNIAFGEGQMRSLTVRLARLANKQISVSDPLVDGTLPDGSRIQLTLGGDVATRGSNFTIRNFSSIPLTPVDLINFNTFSVEQMAYFWLAIENGRSLIFAGGTGSGKTTSMNAVSFFVPPDSKVVSIEDTLEITLPHENWVQSTTRKSASASGRGEVGTYQLLESALRQRPEYILVGEIRTDPNVALTFFQAIGTGHTAYTTFHADSVEGVLSRLQNPPLEVPVQMVRQLDIVSIQKQVFQGADRVRRTDEVAELVPGEEADSVRPRRIYEWNPTVDGFEQVGDSAVLAEIAEERGWNDADLTEALEKRRAVLRYLIDADITDYQDVAATIKTFLRDPEFVMEHIEAGDLSRAHIYREA